MTAAFQYANIRLNMDEHQSRLKKEIEWYEGAFNATHLLNRWPLYSHKRNESSYHVAKAALMRQVKSRVRHAENVLVAPCGVWRDLPYLQKTWPTAKFVGIDISPSALEASSEETHVGDVRQMPFQSNTFDVALATLFFHHIADEGFSDYLREYKRVLRPGGVLVAMEQSMFHPFFAITRPLKKAVGNITGQVEHEHPISIALLDRDCRAEGFSRVETFACSFGHNRTPVPLRAVLNTILYPLKAMPLLKHLGWQVGLIAYK